MNRDPNKLPFGHKRCKSPNCNQVIVGLRTKLCPHCGVDQFADNKVTKPTKATKVKVSTAITVVEQKPLTVQDPFTFQVNLDSPRIMDKLPKGTSGKYSPEIVRHTGHLNPVLSVLAANGAVMVKDPEKRSNDILAFANDVELPNDYNADMIPVILADEGFEDFDNPVYAPYVDRVDVPRYAVK